MKFPEQLIAGDTFTYTLTDSRYPSSEWVAHLVFRGASSYESVGTVNADGSFTFKITPTDFEQFTAGVANYVIYVANVAGDQYTIEQGPITIELRADLYQSTDVRTTAQQIVDAIDAAMLNKATADQMSYTIAGRSLSRIPPAELLSLRNYYKDLAERELRKARGKTTKTKLVMRPL